eukprot:PhM_4_TR13731/c4_g1_i1/m.25179
MVPRRLVLLTFIAMLASVLGYVAWGGSNTVPPTISRHSHPPTDDYVEAQFENPSTSPSPPPPPPTHNNMFGFHFPRGNAFDAPSTAARSKYHVGEDEAAVLPSEFYRDQVHCLRNVVVDTVAHRFFFDPDENPHIAAHVPHQYNPNDGTFTYPSRTFQSLRSRRSRHDRFFVKSVIFERYHHGNITAEDVPGVAAIIPPLPGACFRNAWHTVADYMTVMFHTLSMIRETSERDDATITVFTATCGDVYRLKECYDVESCTKPSLFWFVREMVSRVYWFGTSEATARAGPMQLSSSSPSSSSSRYLRFPKLCIGANAECSPFHVGLNTPTCQSNLWSFRRHFLLRGDTHNNNNVDAAVSSGEMMCPRVVYLSRANAQYRRWFNDKECLELLETHIAQKYCHSNNNNNNNNKFVQTVVLHGKLSAQAQIDIVHNATIIITGRGAASAFLPFLRVGGGFLSITADKWEPYSDMDPWWYATVHRVVKMTHHEDPRRAPVRFSFGYDSNRCGYVEQNPSALLKSFDLLVEKMKRIDKQAGEK